MALKVFRLAAMTLIASGLSGCAEYYARQSQQYAAQAQAQDDAQCRSYGTAPGSPAYVQCRMNLDNQRTALATALIAHPIIGGR